MPATKILRQDLGFDIQNLLTELETARSTKATLSERLTEIETNITDHTDELLAHSNDITSLQGDVNKLKGGVDPELGNYHEKYGYDANGNVIKETWTGDKNYTIDYVYKDAVNGTLDYSEKKYVNTDGKNVTIKKVYVYDTLTGNIVDVDTTTTIV